MTMEVVHPNSDAAINPQNNYGVGHVLKATDKYVFFLTIGHTSEPFENVCYTIDQCDCVLHVFNIVSNRWKKLKVDAEQQKPCGHRSLIGICNDYMVTFDRRFISPPRNAVVQRLMMLPLTVKAKANPWIPMNYTGIGPGVADCKNMMSCPTKPHRFYVRKCENDEEYRTVLGFGVYSLTVDVSMHTGEWEHVGNYPLGCGLGTVLYNAKIVSICASKEDSRPESGPRRGYLYLYVREFDVDKKECKTTKTLQDDNHGWPFARHAPAIIHHLNCLYVIGGEINDMWQLNLDTYRWKKLPFQMHKDLFGFAAAVTPQGCLYVFGGQCFDVELGQTPTNHDLARMWLSPAPLRQLALKRVQQLQPDLKLHSATDLAVYGIPTDIIQDIKQIETEFIE